MPQAQVCHHHGKQRRQHRLRQISILHPRLFCVDQPAQMMHANAKVPFLLPHPCHIQLLFIALRGVQARVQVVGQRRNPRPIGKERAADHRIQHAGMARQIGRQCWRRGRNVDHQIHQRRVRLEQGKHLHPRRQAAQKAVKRHQRLIRIRSSLQTPQQAGRQTFENLPRAVRSQRRIVPPARHDCRGFIRQNRGHLCRNWRKEHIREFIYFVKSFQQPLAKACIFHPTKRRYPRHAQSRTRQIMRLRIPHHLQPMFHFAVRPVGIRQHQSHIRRHPALLRQPCQPAYRRCIAQICIPPAGNQLPRLREKLDLADATRPQLQVMPFYRNAMQPPVVTDAQAHVMRILYRCVIQMLAPHEGHEALQEPQPRRHIPRTGPRLDECCTFPRPTYAFIIRLRRRHRQANRCDRCIGPQPQVGTEHITLIGDVRQKAGHFARGAHKGLPHLGIARIACIVIQADQVDVRRIVQFMRAHLAHGQHHHARCAIIPRQFAPPHLIGNRRPQGQIDCPVGQHRQRPCHLFQRPDPAQISQRRIQRHPALCLPQGRAKHGADIRQNTGHNRMRFHQQRQTQPIRLAHHQRRQIGAAPCRPGDQWSKLRPQIRQRLRRRGPGIGVKGDGVACDAGGKGHVPIVRRAQPAVNHAAIGRKLAFFHKALGLTVWHRRT